MDNNERFIQILKGARQFLEAVDDEDNKESQWSAVLANVGEELQDDPIDDMELCIYTVKVIDAVHSSIMFLTERLAHQQAQRIAAKITEQRIYERRN